MSNSQKYDRRASHRWNDVVPGFFVMLSAEKVLIIIHIEGIELVLSAETAVQRIAVIPELHVLQTAGDTTVAVRVEGVHVDAGADVAPRVYDRRISDRDTPAVDHAGTIIRGRVDEAGVLVHRIIRTLQVAIAERGLQVGRDLSAPLFDLPVLLCSFNSFVEFQQGFLV